MKKQVFNPYLPGYEYIPDGEPRVFGDRLYVYGSHDAFNGDVFCLNDYCLWSAPVNDLSAWRNEGIIYKATQDPRNLERRMQLCAPDCVQGPDGRYYLYYQLHLLTCTSVAVSDRPHGPYSFYGYVQHPDGTPWGEQRGDSFVFDPGVLVDDDNRAYLYAGFGPAGDLKKLMELRGNRLEESVCMELEPDMKTVIGREYGIVPGPEKAVGTEFEAHPFYEASSIRKFNGRYYYVYSSTLSHELCYAVSDRPTGGFRYGGTLISIGDVGYQGRLEPDNYTGNTHGGLAKVNGQYYIFYHRQTNQQMCARQGCAEKIRILPDGSIPQVEMTSCGLNGGPLRGKGLYEACIACNLLSSEGTFAYLQAHETDETGLHPYFTQSGGDREEDGETFIANMTDGSTAGFKYFAFEGDESQIRVCYRGNGNGKVVVHTGDATKPAAAVALTASENWNSAGAEIRLADCTAPLFFSYWGTGAIDFAFFEIS